MGQCLLGFLENCHKYHHSKEGSEYLQDIAERLEGMLYGMLYNFSISRAKLARMGVLVG